MIAITEIGNPVYHLIALTAAYVYRPTRRAVRPFLLTYLAAFAGALFFQFLIGRPRPEADAYIWPQPAMPAYPSGHTTAAAAFAMLIGLRQRRWPVWMGAATWVVAIAASRVYLRHHHLDDVLGGAAFGAALGVFGYGMTASDQRQSRLRWFVWLQLAVIVVALHTAYLGIMPMQWLRWPFADKTLHALLIGGAGFWLNIWLNGRAWRAGALALPVGIAITFGIALIEEFLQLLSPNRTFDLLDLVFDVIGLCLAWVLSLCLLARRDQAPRAPAA